MRTGRPLKFESVEALEAAIEAYFKSCWDEHWKEEIVYKDGKIVKDENGNSLKEWKPQLDRHGNTLLIQITPYTITGLAVALDTSRRTLIDYEYKEEFSHTIKKAKDICEQFLEEGMFKGTIPAVPGIFNAKNNYGWVDKHEVDSNLSVTEMPTIKKDGKEVKYNIGPDATNEPGTPETT